MKPTLAGRALAALDTPGGHIVICFALMGLACGMYHGKMPEYKEVLTGSLAVLFAAMRGRGGAA